MNGSTFGRVAELFHLVLQRPDAERDEFLRAETRDDEPTRSAVLRLLAADSTSGDFLTSPAIGPGFSIATAADSANGSSLRRVGRYRLLRPLGSGGVGHVWLAQRDDGQFDQHVAIKLIRRGMDTPAELERFRQERQLLARLEHPNIARLIDGGATDDGLPYLVMEYVDGVPIDEYCRRTSATLAQRLALFREVCAAVQSAHQNLIIHRDIKPGNILVTSDGRPKLLDFGIAKAIESTFGDSPASASTRRPLTHDCRLLTPEYASPEQLRGQPISTASDVYSLGVVLYELLTGVRPWEAGDLVRDDRPPPPRPSTRVQAAPSDISSESDRRRLAKQLSGDLDTIALTALEADPARRYRSVQSLADDLQRYADRRPIAARPPTWTYLAARFAQRHRLGITLGAVALLATIGGFALTTRAYLLADAARRDEAAQRRLAVENAAKAEDARTLAEQEAQKARDITEFLRQTLTTSDPALKLRPGVSLREIVDEASASLAAPALSLSPDAEAAIRLTLGRTYLGLKLPTLAEPHLRRAWDLQLARNTEDAALAETGAEFALALCEQRKFVEGIPLHRRTLALQRTLQPLDESAVMRRIWRLSTALRDNNEFAEAEQLCREALDISLRLHGERHLDTADCRFRLGFTLNHAGNPADAVSQHTAALQVQRDLLGESHPTIANTLLRLGQATYAAGEREAGIALMRDSLAMHEQTSGRDHPNTTRSLSNLARTLYADGQNAEGDALLAESIERWRSYYGPQTSNVANALLQLARYRLRAGDAASAEPVGRQSLELFRATDGPHHQSTLQSQVELADTLAALHRFDEAESLLRAAFDAARETGLSPREQRRSVRGLINLCKLRGRQDADPLWKDCEADWRAIEATLREQD
ncbi:MAG: serine/threonine-protein kinase [Phycisphaerae bacterium]|nr:serine/threonine-protein kinase [Phycisphaerae bacterium]